MSTYVGVDWAAKGWFVAAVGTDDRWLCDLHPSIWSVWHAYRDAALILVDIPIGLPDPDGARRRCDEQAKALLGSRHPSVFYAPVRPAVYEHSLPAAKAINERAGYSIQNQAWSIVPRIREVDEFLDARPGARDRYRETHPEVCFQALNGAPLRESPQTDAGIDERRRILWEAAPDTVEPYRDAVETFTLPRYAPMVTDPSHILDAFVTAVSARREDDLAILPPAPPTDARGLPMGIAYPADVRQLTLSSVEEGEVR